MTLPAKAVRGRPHLTVVRGSRAPLASDPVADWRRLAQAVIACTHDLGGYLVEQRWARVHEVMCERRELLTFMQGMELDTDGRRCLLSLEQATTESEAAVKAMCLRAGRPAAG